MRNQIEKPTVLTDEIQKKVLSLLAQGNYITTACEASGLNYRTCRHWQKRWEDGDEGSGRFAQFFEDVRRAVATGEAAALMRLMPGAPGWQAQAWFLERRFPQRWGKKDRAPEPPRASKPLSEMTQEELDEHARKVGAGKGRD